MKALVFKIPVVENCSVYIQEDHLPYFYDHLHLHPEIQLTLVLKGTGTLFAGNYMGSFVPGDVYWISSNQPHLFKCDPVYFTENNTSYAHSLSVYFLKTGILRHLFHLPELKEISEFILKNNGIYKCRSLSGAGLSRLFKDIRRARESERIILFLQLLRLFALETPKETLSGDEARGLNERECIRMNDVYQFTMKHFHEKISLEKTADIANMTPQAFCRYFKRSTRKTYMHFLNEVRVDHARKLICDKEDTSLSQIAAACGFENASGFTRVFKRLTGVAPVSYRKEFMKGIVPTR